MTILININAALNSTEKKKVAKWITPESTKSKIISDHLFGDNDRLEIPFIKDPENEAGPHFKKITDHLSNHGYKMHDYIKGAAIDKYGRENNIGRILNKTKADPELIKKFTNDPIRNASKTPDHKIIVSRSPEDVAGMSTDRGWTSCMNMKSGINKRLLKHDVAEGTHVAYLVHKDDNDIHKPIARIALKPLISHDGKHKVLAMEPNAYGSGSPSFNHSVRQWTEKNFPLNSKGFYHLPENMYSDRYQNYYIQHSPENHRHVVDLPYNAIEKNDSKKIMDRKKYSNEILKNVKANIVEKSTDNNLHKQVANYPAPHELHEPLSSNPKLKSEHVNSLFDSYYDKSGINHYDDINLNLVQHPNLSHSRQHILANDILKDPYTDKIKQQVLNNPNLSKSVFDKLVGIKKLSTHFSNNSTLKNKLTGSQIHGIIDHHLSPDIDDFDKNRHILALSSLMGAKNINTGHIQKLVGHKKMTPRLASIIAYNKKTTDRQLKQLYNTHKNDPEISNRISSEVETRNNNKLRKAKNKNEVI